MVVETISRYFVVRTDYERGPMTDLHGAIGGMGENIENVEHFAW